MPETGGAGMGHAEQPALGGGQVLGAFSYTSVGEHGWSVANHHDLAGLTADAVAEGRGLIERLPWWDDPSLPFQAGIDVYERPRRLAWLGRGNTPRRFLIHTMYAERDASNRPGNNFTECLVVTRRHGSPSDRESAGARVRSIRPSQLWDPDHWCTPWGAQEVAAARPGQRWLRPTTPQPDVLRVIAAEPTGQVQLHRMFRAVHDALHSQARTKLIAVIDDFIWAGGLLDTVLSLLPAEDLWDATFDVRSMAPRVTLGTPLAVGLTADLNLFGPEFPVAARVPGTVELTEAAVDRDPESGQGRGTAEPCPFCNQWFATLDAQLRQPDGLDPDRLAGTLAGVQAAHERHRQLHPRPERAPAPDLLRGSRGIGGESTVAVTAAPPRPESVAPHVSPAPHARPVAPFTQGTPVPPTMPPAESSIGSVPRAPATPGSWAAGTGSRLSAVTPVAPPAAVGLEGSGAGNPTAPPLDPGRRADAPAGDRWPGPPASRPWPPPAAAGDESEAAPPARVPARSARTTDPAPALSVLARPHLNHPEAARLRALIDRVAQVVISMEDDPMDDGTRRQRAFKAWRDVAEEAIVERHRLRAQLGITTSEAGGNRPQIKRGKGRK